MLTLLFCVSACGDDSLGSDAGLFDGSPDGGVDRTMDVGTEDPRVALEWTPCPWISDAQPGELNATGECSSIEVPLDWEAPDGRTLRIDLRRLPSPEETTTDLIMLNGGPGGSAASFERIASALNPVWRTVRTVLIDARGAGRSTRLGCSAEDMGTPGGGAIRDEEWPGCLSELEARWGAGLAQFNTTQSARDLLEVADRLGVEGVAQVAYGASYGTYWINRALQLDPDVFDAVVLDGIVDATDPDLSSIDLWHDRVTREYLALCDVDAECSARLGGDAVAAVEQMLSRVDAGHCSSLFEEPENGSLLLRIAMGALISSSQARVAIPALAYRVDRCEPRDTEAVGVLLRLVFGDPSATPGPGLFSVVLAHHVTLSELWGDPPPTIEALQAIADMAIAHKNIGVQFGARQTTWPTYQPDDFHGAWATSDVPMLMMNGTLDPQTPIESARQATVFDGPRQTFVEMPAVPHVTLTNSWVRPGLTCSMILLAAFLADPNADLDTSCVDEIDVSGFETTRQLTQALFGSNTLWD